MMKNWIGQYDISYKAELAPSQESSNCIEVRKSIIKTGNLQSPRELYEQDGEGNWALTAEGKMIVSEDIFGPAFCLACKRDETININGEYSRNVCAENKDPSPKCHHTTCVYCKVIKFTGSRIWSDEFLIKFKLHKFLHNLKIRMVKSTSSVGTMRLYPRNSANVCPHFLSFFLLIKN
uniref:Uncharacterized protein n=1 Tax=Meloidogyne enterolobii TaxID=390850 RepID=A0A6V7WMW4_MELEN|nr:unnamed protein product [Meloidogyne enterolobii]